MILYDEVKVKEGIQGVLKLRNHVNEIIDELYEKGIKNICFLGIGGTYASSMQVVNHMQERSELEVICQNAAEYLTTGNKRIHRGTLMVISSVTGSTQEMIDAVKKAKNDGVIVLGFIDDDTQPLAKAIDYEIAYSEHEQLKLFMVADRLMYLAGEFDDYEDYYHELQLHLADALIDVSQKADESALEFVCKHHNDELHYFVGAGNLWGATYSYGMCYWEEMHWKRTKTIQAGEFFHGMLEVVDRDTNVTIFVGEDYQRGLALRVAHFIPQICARYTIIDTADYELKGISSQYRGYVSPFVMRAICQKIDIYLEKINCHPTEIRRYYRQLEY